jgi:hypothetical protein
VSALFRPLAFVPALFSSAIAALSAVTAGAAERLPEPPIYTAPRVGDELVHGTANPASRTASDPSPPHRPFAERASGIALMEMPREGVPGVGYQRPHHALGFRSAGAAQWLHEHGIDASNCYLPLVRLHTKLANSGAASGSVWIYARCALR